MDKSQDDTKFFGQPFRLGAEYPNITLNSIPSVAREAHELIGGKWMKATDEDLIRTENNIRLGFNGAVNVTQAILVDDGNIVDKNTGTTIDGILLALSLEYNPTGHKESLSTIGGIAMGLGSNRFEVRAYDLKQRVFGALTVTGLREYLAKSKARAANTQVSPYKNHSRIKT